MTQKDMLDSAVNRTPVIEYKRIFYSRRDDTGNERRTNLILYRTASTHISYQGHVRPSLETEDVTEDGGHISA